MDDSPWSQFIKRHQRSYTCGDQDVESMGDKFYKPSTDTTKWVASDTTSQQESSPIFGKLRKGLDIRHSKNQSEIQSRPSLASRHSIRGNITNRNDRSQRPQKSTRQLSRDLQKVQRIIQIDNDILKSQINNLNSDLKIKKQNITNKLQSLILEERKEKIKFTQMFQKSMNYLKEKFNQQAQINEIHTKQIHSLKGTIRLLEMNNKAGQALDKSQMRRDNSPLTKRIGEDIQKQKYIQKIKVLQFELNKKSKQLQLLQQHQPNVQSSENSLTFDIQRCSSFSKADKQTRQVLNNCQQLYSLCQTLIQHHPVDPSILDYLNHKLKDSILFLKQSINPTHKLSHNTSFKKTSIMSSDRSTQRLFEQQQDINIP